jgi:hypothetical protein
LFIIKKSTSSLLISDAQKVTAVIQKLYGSLGFYTFTLQPKVFTAEIAKLDAFGHSACH